MAFESLTEKLQNVFKNLRSKGRLTEADVKVALKTVYQSGTGTCDRSGCDERTESGADGDQDRKR